MSGMTEGQLDRLLAWLTAQAKAAAAAAAALEGREDLTSRRWHAFHRGQADAYAAAHMAARTASVGALS